MGKRIYKSRSRSRYAFRKIRKTPRIVKSKRIFRRFIRRNAIKPELKYYRQHFDFDSEFSNTSTTTNPGTYSAQLTPVNLPQGTGVGTRIGNQVNFIKFDFRMLLRAETFTNSAGTFFNGNDNSFLVRCTIWSPRVTFTEAQNYMNGISSEENINFDMVTVHKDWMIRLGNNQYQSNFNSGGTPTILAGGVADSYFKKISLKFPRKVKFGVDGDTALDQEKYAAFVTYTSKFNILSAFHGDLDIKTWYFDS